MPRKKWNVMRMCWKSIQRMNINHETKEKEIPTMESVRMNANGERKML